MKNLQQFSKCFKNQKMIKLPSKKVPNHDNYWINELFTVNYVIKQFCFAHDQNFSKIHQIDKKLFWPKQKNMYLIILNGKPNCQVSRILMKSWPI
jgi:hypothetical protein